MELCEGRDDDENNDVGFVEISRIFSVPGVFFFRLISFDRYQKHGSGPSLTSQKRASIQILCLSYHLKYPVALGPIMTCLLHIKGSNGSYFRSFYSDL